MVMLVLAHDLKAETPIKLERPFVHEKDLQANGHSQRTPLFDDRLHAPPPVTLALMLGQKKKLMYVIRLPVDFMRNIANVGPIERNNTERLFDESTLMDLSLKRIVPWPVGLLDVF